MTSLPPPPSSQSLVPDGYGGLVDAIGVEVRSTRLRAARAANTELVGLYWRIGRLILDRQRAEPWGSGVIKRLSTELRREFPDMKGLSATNLQYMRAFAAAWPDAAEVSQRAVGKLPWGHVCTLLDQLHDPDLRDWYAARDAGNSWSRPVLEHHIATGLHRRIGAAPSNFGDHLEPSDADQATVGSLHESSRVRPARSARTSSPTGKISYCWRNGILR